MSDMPREINVYPPQVGYVAWIDFDDKEARNSTKYIRADLAKSEWLPIESAPKDKTEFLAMVDDCRTIVCWGKVSHVPLYGWIDLTSGDPEDRDICQPTHWMPLPKPPAKEIKS